MKAAFTYWKNGDFFIGYLDEYPEYQTQGESLADLEAHLLDLYADLSPPQMPTP
ncbi:MAG: type II toxin-antitoxin system HicB family antitoxin [Verrucomicrobia bacterium]|nr:type II toxin-antitoxin system HicB family antitoxin [Verrucomicrobiota bacterium]